jgi:hypothetical protein
MRQLHIGLSLVYPMADAVPHITIGYTATSDSYSTFVTTHFPPQQHEGKPVQATKARQSAFHVISWKDQGKLASSLNARFHRGWESTHSVGEEGQESAVQACACAVLAYYRMRCEATIWAEDETRLADAEATFCGFGRTT